MSFDLYVFPAVVTDLEDVDRWREEAEARLVADLPDPAPDEAMERFLAELTRRWPPPDDDPEASPWAFSPLWQPVGPGTILNITWSRATAMRVEIVALAARLGLTVYDPQDEVLIAPPGDSPRWGWLRRRR